MEGLTLYSEYRGYELGVLGESQESRTLNTQECVQSTSIYLSGCESRYEGAQRVRVNPDLELGCSQSLFPPPYLLGGSGGHSQGSAPEAGAGARGGRAELTHGVTLVEGRQRREAGHSTRLVGKYLEGCFHGIKTQPVC